MDALAAIQAQIKQVQEKSEEGQKAMTLDTTIGFAETTSFEIKKPEAEQGTQEKKKELFGEVEMAVGGGPDLTESQQQGLVQIEKNQQEVDQILEMISSGIDDLQGMAEGMGDEIAKQNKMLDEVETTVDRTNEHMQKVQQKMHSTLQKTRGGDKFCMDMVLIFVIVAVGLLIVKLFTLRVCSETSALLRLVKQVHYSVTRPWFFSVLHRSFRFTLLRPVMCMLLRIWLQLPTPHFCTP